MPVLFALLAALSNALNVVMQHVASIGDPQRSKGWNFVRYLLSNPLWLLGWVALAGAFVFQALALHNGAISVVQPLLVTELIFALVLRWLWLRQSIQAVTWWAAAGTCVSLTLFIAMAEPSGGNVLPTSGAWVVGYLAVGGRRVCWRCSGGAARRRRAALLGASTSMLWALVAAYIKATTDTLTQFGVSGMFSHWPMYALAVVGLAAEILGQAALMSGPLSISQPFIVIVDPIVSIALSVWIFGETFTPHVAQLAIGSFAFVAMCVAVTVLARTRRRPWTPPTPDRCSCSAGPGTPQTLCRLSSQDYGSRVSKTGHERIPQPIGAQSRTGTDATSEKDGNVRGPMGVRRKAYKPKKVKDPNDEPIFQRIADRVSYGMGTPLNIAIWIVLVLGWTLLFALSSSKSIQGGTFLPAWFTSTGYNFPLNLVTTVAELYIGFLVGASSNRSERNLEDTLAQIEALEKRLGTLIEENTDLTNKVKTDTALLQDLHVHVAALTKAAGLEVEGLGSGEQPPTT